MKITIFLLLISISSAMAIDTNAQNSIINLSSKKLSVGDLFREIENQTDYLVVYSHQEINTERNITVNSQSDKVINYLKDVFDETDISYKFDNDYIVFSKKQGKESSQQQEPPKLTGVVIDESGQPLPGATIFIKGTKNAVSSDANGKFSIAADANSILQVSFIGHATKEIPVDNKTNVTITLESEFHTLGETVVVGYGVQKKVNVTGAVSTVNMEKVLGNRPVTNVGTALQGSMPGLLITGGSIPGQSKTFNIRGTTSINGGGPLILVDNVPADIDLLNPEDIESVSLLKDAASTAIYGARAAFGVILITTKKAKKNSRLQLNYNNNFGFQKSINRPEQASITDILKTHLDWDNDGKYFADGQDLKEWIGYVEEYNKNPSKFPANGIYMPEGSNIYYYLKDTDPQGAILDNYGFQQTHNASASGGSEKISYRMSLGYTHNQGPLITDKDKHTRLNLSSYISADITDWLTQSLDIRYTNSDRSYVESDVSVYRTQLPRFYPEGTIVRSNDLNGPELPVNSPANYILLKDPTTYKSENPRIFSKTSLRPFKGFEIILEYTFDKNNWDKKFFNSPFYMTNYQMGLLWSDNPSTGRYRNDKRSIDYNSLNTYGTYQLNIKDIHNIKVMAGYSQESRNLELMWAQRDDMINMEMPGLSGATGEMQTKDQFNQYTIRSGFFRVNYDLLDKYLLEINGRYDGSSKFPSKNRFGFFPSFSAGWKVNQEKWMGWSKTWLNELKIRGSWGQIGNQSISEYAYTPLMSSSQASWIYQGKRPVTLGMPKLVRDDFTWETVETLDLGVEFSLFNNRLNSVFGWYQRNTKGMLMPGAEFPSIVGADAPQQNAADLRTRGWEFSINWRDHIGDWGYDIGFNIFDSKSTITKYDNTAGLFYDRNSAQDAKRYREGMTIGEIWGYVTDRYYTIDDFEDSWRSGTWKLKEDITSIKGNNNIRPGDIMFKNLRDDPANNSVNQIDNGRDNVNDPGDRKIIGNETPRFQFGLSAGVRWKGFDLYVFFQGTGKRDAWLSGDLRFPLSYGSFGTVYSHQLDYWKPVDPANGNWQAVNPNAEFPRLYDESKNSGSNNRIQTKYIANAAYIRFKNLTLGYTIPKNVIEKVKLTRAKVFVSIENLTTWHKLPKGYDPERLSWGYPFYRTYSFGVNITL